MQLNFELCKLLQFFGEMALPRKSTLHFGSVNFKKKY